ncbi:MAG TPA: VTT domain-containing protein [Dehalococcoidales bacterium]|nr:VTT domain-containing protein [Dehalococcoidales bacterium]
MGKQAPLTNPAGGTTIPAEEKTRPKAIRWPFVLGIIGIGVTLMMAAAIVYFSQYLRELQHYGYLGAFVISILGGATILIPVPMLAVVFALGGVMPHPWLVGLTAAFGEVLGSLTIYMTGHGAGKALSTSRHGRMQSAYERMLRLMERRGPVTLFMVASVINPFFYPAALAAGALRFGLKKYVPIVFAGKFVKSITVVYAGYFGIKGLFRAIGIDL